jgi:small-conductance mechanosensitive channel
MENPRRSLVAALLTIVVASFHPTAAPAQAIPSPDAAISTDAGAAELDAATVRIDGHPLFRVHGVPSLTAQERAHNIGRRIAKLAADPSFIPESLSVSEAPGGTQVLASGVPLVMFTDADARLDRLTRQQLAAHGLLQIRATVQSYRQERKPSNVLRSSLVAVAVTIGLLLALAAVRWGRRKLEGFLTEFFQRRLAVLKAKDVAMAESQRMWTALGSLLRLVMWLASLLLTVIAMQFVFQQFPWTRDVALNMVAYIGEPLGMLVNGAVAAIPNLVFLLVLAVVTRLLFRLMAVIAEGLQRGTLTIRGFDPDWAWPTYRIARTIVLIFAVVVAYPFIPGSSTEAFKGISLFVGVLVSLGSTSVIGNLLSGYTMIYRRAFRVGDRVRIDDVIGEVMEIRVTVTHLRTPKNEEVILPNSLIMNSKVINYSHLARQQGLILHTNVGIGYEVPWRQVEAMLIAAADATEGVNQEPRPFVLQRGLGDFAIDYELNVYAPDATAMLQTYDRLHRNILDQFNEHGVQIMTPAYESDPEVAKVVPKSGWFASPATPPTSSAGSDGNAARTGRATPA